MKLVFFMGNFYLFILYTFVLNFLNNLLLNHSLTDQKYNSVKENKVCLIYVFATNADSSEKRLSFIIGKVHKPWYFKNKTREILGFLY